MRLPALSTRELNNFILLAGSKTLKDAAEKCSLSQPALSIQLKQLEIKIGVQLVLRSNTQKRFELTPAGTEFLQAARHVIQTLQNVMQRVNPQASVDLLQLRIACLPSLLQDAVSPVLADLSRNWPSAKISVLDGDSAACSTLLSGGKCDVALCSRPVNGPEIKSQCLFSERFWAVLRKDDKRAQQEYLTLDDFVNTTVVNLSDNFAVSVCLINRAIPSIQVNTITALESLLIQGVGTAIVAYSATSSIRHVSLVKIPIADREVTRQIFLSWVDSVSSPLVDAFLNRLRMLSEPEPRATRTSNLG